MGDVSRVGLEISHGMAWHGQLEGLGGIHPFRGVQGSHAVCLPVRFPANPVTQLVSLSAHSSTHPPTYPSVCPFMVG